MALEESTVSLNFGQGMDTKTDPKMLSTKLTLLQNGIFTNAKRVSKRNGYTALGLNILTGGSITSPVMVKSYRNETLLAGTSPTNGNRLFSYSNELAAWIDKGKYNSVQVSKQIIAAPQINYVAGDPSYIIGTNNSSAAYIGGIAAYAYDDDIANHEAPSFASVYFAIVDTVTGVHIANSPALVSSYGSTYGFSKIVALGNSIFALFYISNPLSTPKLCYKTIIVNGSGITLGAEVQVHACSSTNIWSNQTYVYDVITTVGGAFVALASGSSVILYTLNTSGTIVNGPTTITTSGNVSVISLQLDTTGTNAWVYWVDSAVTLKYAIYNASSIASVLAATTAASSVSSVDQITALATSATTQTVYFSQLVEVASGYTVGVYYPTIVYNTLTQAGSVGSKTTFFNGLDIYSKPFSIGAANYMACMNVSQSNPIGIILDLADGGVVAKFLPGSAEGYYVQGYNTTGSTYAAPSPTSLRWPGFLNSVLPLSSTKVSIACGLSVSPPVTFAPISSSNKAAFPASVLNGVQMGVCSISFDFNNIDGYQGVIQQDTLVLNGGLLEQYDGSGVTELGFTIDPDQVSAVGATSGGVLGAGRWIYYLTYSWTDANGNLHQSAPSLGIVVNFTTGTTNQVTLNWAGLFCTQKSNVTVNLYRTLTDGTTAYLLASVSPSQFMNPSGYGWGSLSYVDNGTSDSILQSSQTLYTQGGAVLDNIAPPPSMILWTNNNRIWCIDSENAETTIEYSKTASSGTGISFSTGLLELVIDSKNGLITGASPMDEKTVILKQNGAGYFIGDGANDSGSGSTITGFQFIPSDTGCVNSKSVILFPDGVLFKSLKGTYILTRGGQIFYFAPEVEAYNTQDVQSSLITGNRNQIRFLTSSGSSLLYDYVFKQWSFFTNHTGFSADVCNGLYTYVRTDGSVYQENTSTFLDNATSYNLGATVFWVKATSIQNFQRLRRIAVLGDYQGAAGHGIQVTAYWDWSTNPSSVVSYLFDGSSSVYQFRERVSQQKGNAIQFNLMEITTGASGEYMDFSDLGFEIGVKKGLRKLPASQSVG